MNERIEDIKRRATIRVNYPTVNSDGKVILDNWEEGISISKLTELCFLECAKWMSDGNIPDGGYEAERMLKHFGIEKSS
jgi:hypothetical protein